MTTLVINYLTWRARLIRVRKRSVTIWPEVKAAPHYSTYAAAIAEIAKEFEDGDNMNPRLSNQVHWKGFKAQTTPPPNLTSDEKVRWGWRGKDRARVLYDVHHLHMGPRSGGVADRTGELLFVGVLPDRALFLTIDDHDSFDDGTISGLMNSYAENTTLEGSVYLAGPGVTLGGTQISDTFRAIDIVKELQHLDGQLAAKRVPDDHGDFLLDYDDIVIVDETGAETHRFKGKL
ncbi:hypothetical protein [Rhodoblastus sp.]|uniref:hypothetical protein n=1 Tax=Rhodoblastus sp. TaxID=1962975 RepID=UPI003F9CBB7B